MSGCRALSISLITSSRKDQNGFTSLTNGLSGREKIVVGVAQWIVQSPPKRKIGRSSRLTNAESIKISDLGIRIQNFNAFFNGSF